jgi:hypothetical protein
MTRRVYDELDLQLFYSANVSSFCPGTVPLQTATLATPCPPGQFAVTPALSAPPTITAVETFFDEGGRDLTFQARVVGDPVAGIQAVWVAWTIPPEPPEPGEPGTTGVWDSIDLTLDAGDPTRWTGVLEDLPAAVDPGDVHFVVQAANGVGRVTIDDNVGALYRPGSIPGVGANEPGATDPPAATTMTFTTAPPTPPASVNFGSSFDVGIELLSDGDPVVGKLVRIGIGTAGLPAVTDGDGRATVQLQASLTPSTYPVTAAFAGDADFAASDVSANVLVTARPTTLTLGGTLGVSTGGNPPAVHAILQAAAPPTPLHQRTVYVIFKGTGPANTSVTRVFVGKTDPEGRVDVPSSLLASLPAGNYKVDAYFNGVSVENVIEQPADDLDYAPSTATATLNLHPRALDLLNRAVQLLQPLAALPGARGDKAEDALAKVQAAISKLNRSRPERVGALGELEGAAGDLEAAVKSRLFTIAQLRPIFDLITGAAWVEALAARDRAIARGGRPSKIAEANTSINLGNQRWAQGRFKDAVARYKDAVAKAESA